MARKNSDSITIDKLAALLGLPEHDDLLEYNIEWVFEAGAEAYKYIINEGGSEEEAEEARGKAENEAHNEVFGKWYDGVENAADELFGVHGLEVIPDGSGRRPLKFQIKPKVSWDDAAKKIVETINGVGLFEFGSLAEFLDSGPYTAREAVLTHLHYIPRYPDVYGTSSAQRIYERNFR